MPQANMFLVKCKGTYGKKGDIVKLDIAHDALTDRQKVMLEPYKAPEVVDMTKPLDRTDKVQVVAELERLGIEFDARKAVKELAELLPKE